MALTPTIVKRQDDPDGAQTKEFKAYKNTSDEHFQPLAICDDEGELAQIEGWYETGGALEEIADVSNAAGRVFQIRVCSTHGSDVWMQLFDEAGAAPSTSPLSRFKVPAGQFGSLDFGVHGRKFDNGLIIAPSTTLATYSAAGASAFAYSVGFK